MDSSCFLLKERIFSRKEILEASACDDLLAGVSPADPLSAGHSWACVGELDINLAPRNTNRHMETPYRPSSGTHRTVQMSAVARGDL